MTKCILSFLALLIITLTSCDIGLKKDEIVGFWQLTEELSDPGDGSGTFQEIKSDKIIIFHKDGSFFTNGPMCEFTRRTGVESRGTYSVEDGELIVDGCAEPLFLRPRFEVDRLELTIWFACFEGCGHRYKKISN